MLKKLSDNDLVFEIVATNSPELFAELYDRFSNIVFNKCYGFCRSREEAEDLTHDVFVKLFLKLNTFKGYSKFSTWLYSFTYHFCLNYIQRNTYKKKERRTVVSDQIREEPVFEEMDTVNLVKVKSERLAEILASIKPAEKIILLMKYQEDMSIKEIMCVLKISKSAVKMRIKRAKAKVVKYMMNFNDCENFF